MLSSLQLACWLAVAALVVRALQLRKHVVRSRQSSHLQRRFLSPCIHKMSTKETVTSIPVRNLDWKVLPDIWPTLASLIPNQVMLSDYIHTNSSYFSGDITYAQFYDLVARLSVTLTQRLGFQPSSCAAIFAENSCRWLMIEQAIMMAGGYNAVRGSSASLSELIYILQHSEAKALVVESSDLLQKIIKISQDARALISSLQFVVVLYDNGDDLMDQDFQGMRVLPFDQLINDSYSLPSIDNSVKYRNSSDLATIIYTSGTTNKAKGVVLTHENLLFQIKFSSFSESPPESNTQDPQ